MPRWVKLSLIVAAVLILLLVLLLLIGGNHGPSRHMALEGANHGTPSELVP